MKNNNVKFENFSDGTFFVLAILFFLPFYFIRLKYSWISFNLTEILIIALLAIRVWKNGSGWSGDKDWKKYQLPLALIFLGVASSVLINKNYYVGFGILKGWFILPIIFAAILWKRLEEDDGLLRKVFLTLFASGVLVSIEGIYYKFSGLLTFDGRLRIFFDSPNQLAMFLAPIFLIGLKLVFDELRAKTSEEKTNLWEKGLISIGMFLIALNLYFTKSYGAGLSLGAVFAIIFWLEYRRKTQKRRFILLLIILLVILGWAGSQKYKSIKETGNRSSFASRMMIWKSAGLMAKNNPLFGIGPGNFQNKYIEYQKYFPPYLDWSVPQPHSLLLAFWLEAGLSGLVGFIWLLVLFFRDNKKAIRANRDLGFLCLGVILYFLLHGLIDTTYWRNDMAILFWAVVVVNLHLVFRNEKIRHSKI